MPPIVPAGLEEEPPSDSDNEFYSEDELPNFAFQEDLESDSSQSPVPEDHDGGIDPSINISYSVNYAYELLPQEPDLLASSELETPVGDSNISPCLAEQFVASEGENNQAIPVEPQVHSLPMDNDQIEKIKAVMVNVTLPTSAFPTWASDIPEDSWKDHLMSRIQNTKDY